MKHINILFFCVLLLICLSTVYSQEEFLVICKEGTYKEVLKYIENGANVNYVSKYCYTPLIVASAFNEDEKVIRLLVEKGASLDLIPIGWESYFIKDYFENKSEFDKIAFSNHSTSSYISEFKSSPLWFSARYNKNEKVSELLINLGVKINELLYYNDTPLNASFENPNKNLYKLFLKYGADVNLGEIYGNSALQTISSQFTARFPLSVFQDLIEHGARLNLPDTGRRHSILISASSEQTPEVIEYLISSGADVFETTSGNSTPMHFAANDNNYPEVMDVFLKHGLDINAANDYGDTPLIIACRYNTEEMIYKCLHLGASPYIVDKDGIPPLEIARKRFPSYEFMKKIGEIFLEREM